jgi:AcrR family transcriptional regulator
MRAAAEVFSAAGVDVSLEEIARHAGVGASTLYRHFASKDDLVRAVIQQAFTDEVEPVLSRALGGQVEPLQGLISVLEAAVAMASRHRNALAATKQPGRISLDLAPSFFRRLAVVLSCAQDQGAVRADLRDADLPRLFAMVATTMWFDRSGDGWRRYLALLVEALRPDATTSLPPLIATEGDELPTMNPFH